MTDVSKIISGKTIAEKIIAEDLLPRTEKLKAKGVFPKLVVVLVGENPASLSYIRQKEKSAEKVGILSEVLRFPSKISEENLLAEIKKLNHDSSVHGIIVQLPLPDHISATKVLETILPAKDADGFTAENLGKLFLGQPTLECCTPKGIIRMVEAAGESWEGKNVVILGRSDIVGKPVAIMALNRNATIKMLHRKSEQDLSRKLANADIVIVAVGVPHFLKASDTPQGCIIIDVGIHRTPEGKLCGDVEPAALEKSRLYSPVPGGVGPMTVISLIENTLQAAENLSA